MRHLAKKITASTLGLLMLALFALPSFPVQAAQPPEVEAGAYVLMDANTGQILAEKNEEQMLYPASITKILTLGLILEQAHANPQMLSEMAPVSYRASHDLIYGSTHVALKEGDALSVRDLIYATQIDSANDAANVLAEYSDGSIEGFAVRMNAKISELGLAGSQFINPSGQPEDTHFTTAYDMAQITRWALSVPGFREVFAATEYEIGATASRPTPFLCQNDNPILDTNSGYYYPGVTGSKMGFTNDARYTLVTTARQGDTELLCVVMHCETSEAKYTSTQALLDYGFGGFTPVQYPMESLQTMTVPVFGGGSEQLGEIQVLGGESDMRLLLPNGTDLQEVNTEYIVPESYIIGQGFSPVVRLTVDAQDGSVLLLDVPLSWTGFDELFAENTSVWESAMEDVPPLLWVLLLVMLLLGFLVLGRIIYVRMYRQKRRKHRLAQYQARQPIRIEPRPQVDIRRTPGARQSETARAPQKIKKGNTTPYMYGTEAEKPHRIRRIR